MSDERAAAERVARTIVEAWLRESWRATQGGLVGAVDDEEEGALVTAITAALLTREREVRRQEREHVIGVALGWVSREVLVEALRRARAREERDEVR